MNIIKKNIVANFAGSIWQGIMVVVFTPLYIKFIGIESWGLIGFFATLQAVFLISDMGISGTLNREMARLSALPHKEQEMRNLVRTLEMICWCVAVFIGIIAMSLAPFIAHHWIKAGQLSVRTVEQALLLMGFVIALQLPTGFYSGGLMGLQRQVPLNVINAGMATARGVGAVIILWLFFPTIQAFFLWLSIIAAANIFILAFFFRRELPSVGGKAVFRKKLLNGVWRFAAGMSGISVLAVILAQMDKVILSKMLSLKMFGYYMLASIVAINLGRLFAPFFYSIYPKLTQLVALDDQSGLKEFYHKCCQLISVIILPVTVVVALFSYEIILLWTQNPETARITCLLVSILTCGTGLSGLMSPPYALQLAFGWTRLSFFKNMIAVVAAVPLIICMTARYGAVGAAGVWLTLNIGYIIIEIPIMHRKLLRGEERMWYWQDVAVPLMVCIFVAGIGRILMRGPMPQHITLFCLAVISTLTFGMTAIAAPVTRVWLFKRLPRF